MALLVAGATSAILIVPAERPLNLGPSGFAWLIGVIGMGALAGPVIPNTLARDYRDAQWLFVPYIIRGIGDVLIAVFVPLPIAPAIMFVYDLNTSTGMVVFNATLQDAIPDAVRGRVFTLLDVIWSATRLLSLALGALVANQFGIRPLFWSGGTLLTLVGVLGLVLLGNFDVRRAQSTSNP
jgi:hypothetical protein